MIILLFLILLMFQSGYSLDVSNPFDCEHYNEVHGFINTCNPYVVKCEGYRVYVSAPSFGEHRKTFRTLSEAIIYTKEFRIVVDEWKKIHYTNYYDYTTTIEIKPNCRMELPR